MKQITVRIGVLIETNTEGVDVTAAAALNRDVRRNKSKVIEASLGIERSIARTISHYYFGRSHARKEAFDALILDSDWCSFAAKRKLVTHVITDLGLLEGQDKSEFDKLLGDVMRYRNAFTHGKILTNDKAAWLCYFEGSSRRQELTDDFLTKVEAALAIAGDRAFVLEQKIGATTVLNAGGPAG